MPAVLLLVVLTAVAAGEKDLVLILSSLGFGIPAAVFLMLVAWTTNAGNLYSGSLFTSAIVRTLRHRTIVLLSGGLGVTVALFGLTEYYITFLVTLSITVPPIAGIYVTDYFLRRGNYNIDAIRSEPGVRYSAVAGWGSGVAGAFLSAGGQIVVTGIPACDSVALSALVFWLLRCRGWSLLSRS